MNFSILSDISVRESQDCDELSLPLFIFGEWVTPAITQEECEAHVKGRYGCRIFPTQTIPYDNLLWILDSDQCSVKGDR
jgi:hypothetical protein